MNKTLVSILGGLSGMFGWGLSDFYASESSGRIGHTRTFFWSQIAGLALMGIAALLFVTEFEVTWKLAGLMIINSIAYTVGYLYFYRAFEIGNVSVVSAVVNTQNIFVILVSYFIVGQTLTKFQIPALILIIIGVTLVSINFRELKRGHGSLFAGVRECLFAAFLFGAVFWPVGEYLSENTNWIAMSFIVKTLSIGLTFLIARAQGTEIEIRERSKKLIWLLIVIGVLEATAVLGTTFGVSIGDAIIVAPIASSLTIVTVAMAIVFLKEKITRTQGVGIAITILGIILTAF